MGKRKFRGTLPTGEMTTSADRYAESWRRLAKDVEAVLRLGLVPVGCEPGILFSRPLGRSLSLDTEVCLAIARHAKK